MSALEVDESMRINKLSVDTLTPAAGRKFTIAIFALVLIGLGYASTVVLALLDKIAILNGDHFTGLHLLIGVTTVLGMYGGANVLSKIKGGSK
jgi:hypothetical protein